MDEKWVTPIDTLLDRLVGGAPHQGPTGAVLAIGIGASVRSWVRGWAQTYDDEGLLAVPPLVTPETVFDVGSITKVAATTAAVLRLFDTGRLDLDAPLSRFRPRFVGSGKDNVTIGQLLQHRGGLWEWWPLYLPSRAPAVALEAVDELPLRYSPGTSRHYSDLGFMLLGSVVESVVGTDLDEAVRQLVLEPLGMTSTGYAGTWLQQRSLAATSHGDEHEAHMIASGVPYPVPVDPDDFDFARRHFLKGEANDGNAFHAFGGVAGHAGLFSTAGDLCRLGAALSGQDAGNGFCSPATMARFASPGPDSGQALGFRTRRAIGHRVVEHPGFPGTFWALDLDSGVCVTLLTNRLHPQSKPVPLVGQWRDILDLALTLGADEEAACGF